MWTPYWRCCTDEMVWTIGESVERIDRIWASGSIQRGDFQRRPRAKRQWEVVLLHVVFRHVRVPWCRAEIDKKALQKRLLRGESEFQKKSVRRLF